MGGLVACILNLTLPDDLPQDLAQQQQVIEASDSSLDDLETARRTGHSGGAQAGQKETVGGNGSVRPNSGGGASVEDDDIKEM